MVSQIGVCVKLIISLVLIISPLRLTHHPSRTPFHPGMRVCAKWIN